MALRIVTPSSGGLITLDDAKDQLRVDFGDDDALINALVVAASRAVEAHTQRRYLTQTLEWVRQGWSNPMVLPVAPGEDSQQIHVDTITYAALDGTTQTLDPSIYWARPHGPTLEIARRWFVIYPFLGDAAERVVIRFHVDGDVSTVPESAKHATRLLVSHFYENRDAVVGVENRDSSAPLPLGVETLLFPEIWS